MVGVKERLCLLRELDPAIYSTLLMVPLHTCQTNLRWNDPRKPVFSLACAVLDFDLCIIQAKAVGFHSGTFSTCITNTMAAHSLDG